MENRIAEEETSAGNASDGRVEARPRRRLSIDDYGWCALPVRRVIRDDPAFADFVADANPLQYHLVGLAMALNPREYGPSTDALVALGPLLRRRRVAEVVRAICGVCPPGLAGALWKLPIQILCATHYLLLFDLLGEPGAAKVLRHAPRIDPPLLCLLNILDPVLRRPGFIRLCGTPYGVLALERSLGFSLSPWPDAPPNPLLARLATVASQEGLDRFVRRVRRQAPPSPPPWEGNERLRPLHGVEEIREAGRAFRNCLAGFAGGRFGCRSALYVWQGDEPAIAEIFCDPAAGWRVSEIAGPDNAAVSRETTNAIVQELELAGMWEWGVGTVPEE